MTSNLIEDPLFYNLLDNNKESNTTSINEYSSNPIKQEVVQSNIIENVKHESEAVDFSFLNKVEFPLNGGNTSHQHETMSLSTEQSYQQSVFSDQLSLDSQLNSFNSDFNNLNDFLNKEVPFQTGGSKLPSIANLLPSLPSLSYDQIQPKPQVLEQQQPQAYTPKQFPKQFPKPYSNTTPTTPASNSSISKPALTYHRCPFCQRQFKNKSYLTRHLKKHGDVKDFKCPFFNETSTKCHHSDGEFSRKDTFKAHLKSIHFIYPIGVPKTERNLSSGRCAGCFQEFKNNNDWLSQHIEKGVCPGFAKNMKSED